MINLFIKECQYSGSKHYSSRLIGYIDLYVYPNHDFLYVEAFYQYQGDLSSMSLSLLGKKILQGCLEREQPAKMTGGGGRHAPMLSPVIQCHPRRDYADHADIFLRACLLSAPCHHQSFGTVTSCNQEPCALVLLLCSVIQIKYYS